MSDSYTIEQRLREPNVRYKPSALSWGLYEGEVITEAKRLWSEVEASQKYRQEVVQRGADAEVSLREAVDAHKAAVEKDAEERGDGSGIKDAIAARAEREDELTIATEKHNIELADQHIERDLNTYGSYVANHADALTAELSPKLAKAATALEKVNADAAKKAQPLADEIEVLTRDLETLERSES